MNSRIGQTDPRAIFDTRAAAIDTNDMVGLNAHGNSGLRYEVDHHYKRLFSFAALTSAFEAAFGRSQRNSQSGTG